MRKTLADRKKLLARPEKEAQGELCDVEQGAGLKKMVGTSCSGDTATWLDEQEQMFIHRR